MSNRREEILEAFSKLVSRYGLGKTSMQDIAREAGISIGTIYNDFTNKEDLILFFWKRVEEQCISHLDALYGRDLPPEQRLRELMLEHISMRSELLRSNRGIYELLTESVISYIGKSILGRRQIIQQQFIKRVASILQCGIEEGVFEVAGDVSATAVRFVEAFTEYLAPPLVLLRQPEELLKEAESMFDFVIRAVKRQS